MDFYNERIDNQRESALHNGPVAAFSLSLQGASHLERNPQVPCQDCHDLRWLDGQQLLIAAIADGVGSCELSHWGAHKAVSSALDSLQQDLQTFAQGKVLKLNAQNGDFRQQMKQIMYNAFARAQSAVEEMADQGQQPVFSFQSTLTLAIYDGDCLFHGHVGDDGIVAQLPDGTVEMATRRVKGEEANSVFPLQSGEQFWQFGVVPHVVGFLMATDGVLDSFVATNSQSSSYFGGICYSFMENAIYTLAEKRQDAPEKALKEYKDFLLSDGYRAQVCDDLTLVAVVNPLAVRSAVHPRFDMEVWKSTQEKNRQAQQQALYGRNTEESTEGATQEFSSRPADGRKAPAANRETPIGKRETPAGVPGIHAVKTADRSQPHSASDRKQASAAVPARTAEKPFGHSGSMKVLLAVLAAAAALVVFIGGFMLFRSLTTDSKQDQLTEENRILTERVDALQKELEKKDQLIGQMEQREQALIQERDRLQQTLDEIREKLDLIKETKPAEAPAAATEPSGVTEPVPGASEETAPASKPADERQLPPGPTETLGKP